MIKKAVLLTLSAPFLMVFSDSSFAVSAYTCAALTRPHISVHSVIDFWFRHYSDSTGIASYRVRARYGTDGRLSHSERSPGSCSFDLGYMSPSDRDEYLARLSVDPSALPKKNDHECKSENSGSINVSPSVANYLAGGGTVKTAGGACAISIDGTVGLCPVDDGGNEVSCNVPIQAVSTDEFGSFVEGQYIDSLGDNSGSDLPTDDFQSPDYLNPLPGGCVQSSDCVTIGDTSYLVDWDSAPDWFSYVDHNGNTVTNPNAGGGSNGGDTGGGDPTNPTDPTDPGGNDGGDSGGDSGGSDGGNDSGDGSGGSSGGGGGSTVPDFEFDESGIIEAIRSSGQSNRNAIDALSNDVTGSINNQTNELNTTINTEASRLITETDRQTGRVTTAITSQTQSIQNTLDNQTRSLNSTLEGLESSLVGAFGDIRIRFSGGGGGSGGGSSDGGEGDEEGDGIDGFLDGLVDKLADRFTEEVGDGDDLFNSSGLDETLDNAALEEQEYTDEINTLMDEIGDGATSGIAEQVTSRLPSLPSGGCTPLQFGPMEISCQAFNTIKLWLTWIVYFWTVVSIVDTFFRSEQRTA